MSDSLVMQARYAVFYRALLFSLAVHLTTLAWVQPLTRVDAIPLPILEARLEPQVEPRLVSKSMPVVHKPVPVFSPPDLSQAAPVPVAVPSPVTIPTVQASPSVVMPTTLLSVPTPSQTVAVAPKPSLAMTAVQLPPVLEVPRIVQDAEWYPARKLDAVPRRLGGAQPKYPESAQRHGVTGILKVRMQVNTLGEVESVEIVSAQPEGVFDAAVLAFFKTARYQPPQRDGRPVRAIIDERVSFVLNDAF